MNCNRLSLLVAFVHWARKVLSHPSAAYSVMFNLSSKFLISTGILFLAFIVTFCLIPARDETGEKWILLTIQWIVSLNRYACAHCEQNLFCAYERNYPRVYSHAGQKNKKRRNDEADAQNLNRWEEKAVELYQELIVMLPEAQILPLLIARSGLG